MPISGHNNIIQKATYWAAFNPAGIAMTTTATEFATLHHVAAGSKNARIRRILLTVAANSAACILTLDVIRLTAAPTATAVTAVAADPGDAAANTVCGHTAGVTGTPTGTAFLSQKFSLGIVAGSTSAVSLTPIVFYDWQESGETRPLALRAGVLEGWAIRGTVSVASTVQMCATVVWTEE